MRDGYYISAYLSINSLANLYDISLRHDQTVALWLKQGNRIELVKYWELERKTGLKKHAKSLFSTKQCIELIENLLLEVKLKMNDIVEIWGTPGIGENISSYDSKLEYPYHSLCHLFSGLLVDSNVFFHENILAFALDGGPDNVVDIKSRNKEFYWGAFSHKGEVEYFNIPSPGAFWSIIKIRYGLEEGSLMALGSATTAYYRNINDVMDKYPYIYNADDFTIAYDWISRLCEYIETIDINNIEKYDHRFSEKDNRISVVVKIVQEISKDMLEKKIKKIINAYGINPYETTLAMTGGFALNCPTNTYIMKKFGFKAFSTCPCVSDTGIALGIGLYEFFMKMGYFEFALDSAYHGSVSTKLVEDLDTIWLRYIESVTDFDGDRFVNDIIDKPLVWFEGSSEIGPRALGARSILGDPRTEKTRDILNVIKQRQWWRPVAPIIIDEEKEHWFNNTFSSPYMLCTAICKMDKVSFIPAALHLDYSARIQTISDNSSYLYRAISAFYDKTGVPLICNTSLNDKGEPIIDTIEQCLNFALKKNINIIYYNGKRIEIKNHIEYEQDMVLERNIEWVQLDDQDIINAKRILNPYNLSSEELDLYLNFPELFLFDVTDEKQVNQLKKVVNYWKKLNNSFWTKLLD